MSSRCNLFLISCVALTCVFSASRNSIQAERALPMVISVSWCWSGNFVLTEDGNPWISYDSLVRNYWPTNAVCNSGEFDCWMLEDVGVLLPLLSTTLSEKLENSSFCSSWHFACFSLGPFLMGNINLFPITYTYAHKHSLIAMLYTCVYTVMYCSIMYTCVDQCCILCHQFSHG